MPPATATAPTKRHDTYDETTFEMPRIAQSKAVLWYPDRHTPDDSYTAFVTRVADRSVDLAIMRPDQTTLFIRNGVRHKDDPDGAIIDRSGNGVWEFAEDDVLMVGMMKTIKALNERITSLVDRVERLEKK